jgi:replicative DNA helicase
MRFGAIEEAYDDGLSVIRVRRTEDGSFDLAGRSGITIEKRYEPHNIEAEAGLLGALMIDNRLVDDVAHLRAEHFMETLHAEIYEAIRFFVADGKVANPVTLRPRFERHEMMKQVGGPAYLAQLTGSGAAIIGCRDFANQIIELSELRRIREQLRAALEDTDGSVEKSPLEIIGDLETGLMDCLEADAVKTSHTLGEAFEEAVDEIKHVSDGDEPNGILITGLENYNLVRGRMEGGDFDLLGGRPSMGKTALAVAIALGAAEEGHGVEFISLEMSRQKMSRRALAQMIYKSAGDSATYEQIIKGRLGAKDWEAIEEARERIKKMPLSISDPNVMYVEDVIPFLRKRKRALAKRGITLKLVLLDYLGRLQTRRRFTSETEIVSYISRLLKQAAKELDVCLIALAQLSRALEARDNKRPMLADLRQSGSLEQDADNVIFVYRDEYYLERVEPPKEKAEKWNKWADEISAVRDDMEVFSAKRREGALSKRTIKFFTRHQALRDFGAADWLEPTFFEQDDPAMSMGR